MNVGDRVRIDRDEVLYPSRGTWPQFRGRTGTVVEVNADRKRPHLTEYGVVFGEVWPRVNGGLSWNGPVTWFKLRELQGTARPAVRHAEQRSPLPAIN